MAGPRLVARRLWRAPSSAERQRRKVAGTLPDDLSDIWLPGLVSQSVVLWDAVGLEMVLGPKRHLSLSLSLEPLR